MLLLEEIPEFGSNFKNLSEINKEGGGEVGRGELRWVYLSVYLVLFLNNNYIFILIYNRLN